MKGITAVIAVILLLLITIAITGFAFVFFSRTVETTAESGEQQLGQQIEQIGTRFQIDGVDKNRIYIRNTGTTPLTNLAFYVENRPVSYAGPSSLASNSVGTYTLDASQIPYSSSVQARVTSAVGSEGDALTFNNLCVNPGFEDGTGTDANNWTPIEPSRLSETRVQPGYSGSWTMRTEVLAATPDGNHDHHHGLTQDHGNPNTNGMVGKTYVATVRAKANPGVNYHITLWGVVGWVAGDGTANGYTAAVGNGDWQILTTTPLTVIPAMTNVHVRLAIDSETVGTRVEWDEYFLAEVYP